MYHLKFRNEKVNSVVFFKTFRQISKIFVLFFFLMTGGLVNLLSTVSLRQGK